MWHRSLLIDTQRQNEGSCSHPTAENRIKEREKKKTEHYGLISRRVKSMIFRKKEESSRELEFAEPPNKRKKSPIRALSLALYLNPSKFLTLILRCIILPSRFQVMAKIGVVCLSKDLIGIFKTKSQMGSLSIKPAKKKKKKKQKIE